MMMDRVAGRLWSRRGWLRRPVGHHVRRLSLTRRRGRKSRDDNASQASLVTADGGRYGGCVPLPPSCGGRVPQPPLPAGTASVTIQRDATEAPAGGHPSREEMLVMSVAAALAGL